MLAVLGFHRSLTSVVAQWLHRAGLPMGDFLMPPSPSNPDGHFEDMLLVRLHEQLLTAQHTDWQFHNEVNLDPFLGEAYFRRYVSVRSHRQGHHWGMKDPRQCLFLPAWERVLGSEGRYLAVLRHWSASLQSLMNRHAGLIALSHGSFDANSRFWRYPEQAAEQWMAYNQRLLDFLKRCPEQQRFVVTQTSVLGGISLVDLLNKHFGLGLRPNTPSPIKTGLVQDRVDESIKAMLPQNTVMAMDKLWGELLALADCADSDEKVRWVAPGKRDVKHDLLARALLKSASRCQPNGPSTADEVEPRGLLNCLYFHQKHPKRVVSPESLWEQVTAQAPDDPKLWLNLAKAYINKALPGWGQKALTKAHEVEKGQPSWQWYSLKGQCALMTLNLEEAQADLQTAFEMGPDNPASYVQLARVLLMAGDIAGAIDLLSRGLQHLGNEPALVQLYTVALDLKGDSAAAVAYLDAMDARPDTLDNQRITLLLRQGDFQAGREYNQWALQRSLEFQTWETCLRYLSSVEVDQHKTDLAFRIVGEWRRFETNLTKAIHI